MKKTAAPKPTTPFLKTLLYKWMLPKLISKKCMSEIPRSGEEGKRINCYTVTLDLDGSPFFLATEYKEQILTGSKWDGHSYANKHSIKLSELENGKLRVRHYYGLTTLTYDSIYDIVFQYITKFIYLKIHLHRHINVAFQYFFNKRKLITKKRIELIQFMMDDQLDRTHDGITSFDLMMKLYSINWVLHPSGDEQKKRLELYLDSLVMSKELQEVNNEYIITGKAISTIEKYEEEERRHTEAVKLQKKMFWLTILLLFIAIAQLGIIKKLINYLF